MLSLSSTSLSHLHLFLPPIYFRIKNYSSHFPHLPITRPYLPPSLFSLHPSSPERKQQFSDLEDEDEAEEDEEDAQYGVSASGDVSEDGDEFAESDGEIDARPSNVSSSQYRFHKWQRVERLIAEVREFGEEIIDFDELAGVYDFPIDKFQVCALGK